MCLFCNDTVVSGLRSDRLPGRVQVRVARAPGLDSDPPVTVVGRRYGSNNAETPSKLWTIEVMLSNIKRILTSSMTVPFKFDDQSIAQVYCGDEAHRMYCTVAFNIYSLTASLVQTTLG
jgi:hypothetical protein